MSVFLFWSNPGFIFQMREKKSEIKYTRQEAKLKRKESFIERPKVTELSEPRIGVANFFHPSCILVRIFFLTVVGADRCSISLRLLD